MTQLYDSVVGQLVREVGDLGRRIERLMSSRSLYTVLNERTPAQITANQNDYAPGDYDVLRMSSDAARNLTGLSGGKMGRLLRIINIGSFNIVIVHESSLSVAANRIVVASVANLTLATTDSATLYYDSTTMRWRVVVPSA